MAEQVAERVIYQGYVIKSPPTNTLTQRRWMVRYFVLTEIGHNEDRLPRLCYYASQEDYTSQNKKGEVTLVDSETLLVAQISRVSDHFVYHYLIAVLTPSQNPRTYYFAVKTELLLKNWLDALAGCIPGCVSGRLTFVRNMKLSTKTEPLSSLPDGNSEEPQSAARARQDESEDHDEGEIKAHYASIELDKAKRRSHTHSGELVHGAGQLGTGGSPVAAGVSATMGRHATTNMKSRKNLYLPKNESFKEKRQAVDPNAAAAAPAPTPQQVLERLMLEHQSNDLAGQKQKIERLKHQLRSLTTVVSLSDIAAKAVCKLGEGNFGTVCEVVNRNQLQDKSEVPLTVAIKTLKANHSLVELGEFFREASLLAQLDHRHVVSIIAVQMDVSPYCIVMEVMNEGNLKSYLQDCCKEGIDVPYIIKLWIMLQVAVAMNYISVQKGILHRDLAARNILLQRLANEEVIAKVSDFGLAKNSAEYVLMARRTLPVKWLALETMRDGVYTVKTDVWSFAVALWETMSSGAVPYNGVLNSEMFYRLEEGLKLKQPDGCSDGMYAFILSCMDKEPEKRPTFAKISHVLGGQIKAAAHDEYVNDQVDGYLKDVNQIVADKEARVFQLATSPTDDEESGYTPMLPASLAKSLPAPTAESVDSLSMADLRKILINCSDGLPSELHQFKNDITWLRRQVKSIWDQQNPHLGPGSKPSTPTT